MEDDFTRFADVWIKLTTDLEGVLTFRKMGMLGLESATAKLYASNVQFVRADLVSGDFKHFLKDPDAFVREGHDSTLIKAMTEGAVGCFEQSLNSAALVFAHSILDSALHDCLWISAFSAPQDWMEYVAKKNIPLSELDTKSPAESLLKKVDRLFQLCKPKKQTYLTNGFRFDRGRLEKLDALRHAIVHAPGRLRQFPELADDLDFLRKCGLHILAMLSETYMAGLNIQEVLAAYQRRKSSDTGTR
jgi:hypothetical protein